MVAGGSSDDNLEEEGNLHSVGKVLKPYKPRFHDRKKAVSLSEDNEWQLEDGCLEEKRQSSIITSPLYKLPLTIEHKTNTVAMSSIVSSRNFRNFVNIAPSNKVPENIAAFSRNRASDFTKTVNDMPSSMEEPLNLMVDGRVIRHVPGMPGPVEEEALKPSLSGSSELISPMSSTNLNSVNKSHKTSEYINSSFPTGIFKRVMSPVAVKQPELMEPLNLTSPTSPLASTHRKIKSHSLAKEVSIMNNVQQRQPGDLNCIMLPSMTSRSTPTVPATLWFPASETSELKLTNSPVPKQIQFATKAPTHLTDLTPTTASNLNSRLCCTNWKSLFIPPPAYLDSRLVISQPLQPFSEKMKLNLPFDIAKSATLDGNKVCRLKSMAWKAYNFENEDLINTEISEISKSSMCNFSALNIGIPTSPSMKTINVEGRKSTEQDSLSIETGDEGIKLPSSSFLQKPNNEESLASPIMSNLQRSKPNRPTSLAIKPLTPTLAAFKPNKTTPQFYPVLTLPTPQTPSRDHRHKPTMTKLTYCTLRQPQPCYVVVTVAPYQLSMYSRWRPKKRKFDSSFCSSYDSSRLGVGVADGCRRYTVAGSGKSHGGTGTNDDYIVVHSSYKYSSEIIASIKKKKDEKKRKDEIKSDKATTSSRLRSGKMYIEKEKSSVVSEAMDASEKDITEPEEKCGNDVKFTEKQNANNEHDAAYCLLTLSSCQHEQKEKSG